MSLIQTNRGIGRIHCCDQPPYIIHHSTPIDIHGPSQPQQPFDELFGSGFSQFESELDQILTENGNNNNNNNNNDNIVDPAQSQNGIKCEKDKYQIMLNLKQFKPEEIHVNTFDDHCLVVEGIHEEKPDEHGYVIETFKRRYLLPDEVKPENIYCLLTSNGTLKVEVLRPTVSDADIDLNVKTEALSIKVGDHTNRGNCNRPNCPVYGNKSLLRGLLTINNNKNCKVLKPKPRKPKNFKPLKNVKWCEDVRG